jgi:hypothetical protein
MPVLRSLFSLILFGLLLTLPTHAQNADAPEAAAGPITPKLAKTLNNGSITRMVQAGLGDDLILEAIRTQPGAYSVDADAMVELKEAGVSERVITAMINKGRKKLTANGETADDPAPPPIALSPVNELGVYYKDRKGIWQPLQVEVVHAHSGGWIKSTATHGIIKTDMNGRVNGPTSKLALQAPVEILIFATEGTAPTEYDFLRFRLHSDYREFRTLTGGVFHSTGGADRDEVAFDATKTAPRTYTFTIDRKVGTGEFGILPPGTGNVTNGGKIYTFALTE